MTAPFRPPDSQPGGPISWGKVTRGHILFVLEGKLLTEIQGGGVHTLTAGMSYQVSDDVAPHRSSTETGARLFIVD